MPSDTNSAVEFHSIPIKTCFEGTTNVKENFSSHTCTSIDGKTTLLTNSFRGRSLQGKMVHAPEQYRVALMSFSRSDEAAGTTTLEEPFGNEVLLVAENNRVYAASDHFVQWEHDRKPEGADAISNWVSLANDIHS